MVFFFLKIQPRLEDYIIFMIKHTLSITRILVVVSIGINTNVAMNHFNNSRVHVYRYNNCLYTVTNYEI